VSNQEEAQLTWEQRLFTMILHAGNARSKAIEAAESAEEGRFSEAEAALVEAETEQLKAHEMEVDIIQMEASGEEVPFSVLLMHAMDLLLLSWAEIDHTRQVTRLCERLENLENEVKKWEASKK
jgi:cellobiose PTS system EIIA component